MKYACELNGYCERGLDHDGACVPRVDECEECGEIALKGSVLCATHAVKELRLRVTELLDSASPNPKDHPTMTWAWERAQRTLDRVKP